MKITQITRMTAGLAFVLLASCGQDETTGNAPASDDIAMSVTDDAESGDWLPAGIVLPQPHTVVQDAKLGTRTRLLQVVVENDPKEQFAQWQSGLEAAGYKVSDSMLSDGRLLFEGADVESGQIAVSQPDDQNGYMIQVDVSKVSQ